MFIAYAIVASVLSLALVGSAVGKLTKNPKIVESISGVGVPLNWLPLLALAELAGAAGLIIGLWVPALGIAAGVGVVLYFLGAVIAHLRVKHNDIAPPLVLGLVAVATIVLRSASI